MKPAQHFKLTLSNDEVLFLQRLLITTNEEKLKAKVNRLCVQARERKGPGSRTYLSYEAFIALFSDRPETLVDAFDLPDYRRKLALDLLQSNGWNLAKSKRVRNFLVASGKRYGVLPVLMYAEKAKPHG